MFRNAICNLYTTIHSIVLAWRMGQWHRWVYPRIDWLESDFIFDERGDRTETDLFNRLKYSWVMTYLKRMPQPLVLRCAYTYSGLQITAYRLIHDEGQTDLTNVVKYNPGQEDGLFHYIHYRGVLHHVLRANSTTRQMGYIENEPVFSLRLPLLSSETRQLAALAAGAETIDIPVRDACC